MKVLGILQNVWVRDPGRVRDMLARSDQPERLRRRFIAYALFAGCRTGSNLRATLGASWCERIVWDEASRELGAVASSVFPADPDHLRELLDTEAPRVVLGFGRVACDALAPLIPAGVHFLQAPHPAARSPLTLSQLRACRQALDHLARS